jgi:hypothetical protein
MALLVEQPERHEIQEYIQQFATTYVETSLTCSFSRA